MDWARRTADTLLGVLIEPFHPHAVKALPAALAEAMRVAATVPVDDDVPMEDWERMASRPLLPLVGQVDPLEIEHLHGRILGALVASHGRPEAVIGPRKSVLAK